MIGDELIQEVRCIADAVSWKGSIGKRGGNESSVERDMERIGGKKPVQGLWGYQDQVQEQYWIQVASTLIFVLGIGGNWRHAMLQL